jgi:hypothetical protein
MWLYTKKARRDPVTKEIAPQYNMSIMKLWIFADRRDIPLLMNEMIDAFQQSTLTTWQLPGNPVVREAYNKTNKDCALRRLLTHLYTSLAGKEHAEGMMRNQKAYPRDFLHDMVTSLLVIRPRQPRLSHREYEKTDVCSFFHTHENGVTCTGKGTKRSWDEMAK